MTQFFRRDLHDRHLELWNTFTETRNALTPEYYQGVIDGLREASENPAITAVILSGEGGFFCSGGDLNQLKERRDMTLEQRYANINRLHDIIRAIRACPKPVISAVEGGAAGAGLSIALACDMVVSAEKAKFVLAYVRAGLVPDGGVTRTLMQMLPRATVAKMAMMAKPLLAERLYDLGAITEIVAKGAAMDTARGLAAELSTGPERAIASIKTLMNQAEDATMEAHLDTECEAMARALGGGETQIGISAFLNKQTPIFR
ncbi:enoyl-CoA hydratase [Cognatishimia sp. WU-CL00825]|uniref:oxepin-CoA hydrolase, alternative type n=1 Tax=Cognatishimia sp. WU-CL00825 TaxID=3127658 RepID=UPI00310463B1